MVHETMVDKLTERVHLQRRIDVVYHGGEPEASESCGVAMRALWAVPLVLAVNGLKRAAKPLAGCCSVGRVPPERLAARGAPEAPQSDAPPPDAPVAAKAVEGGGGPVAAEAPAAAAPSIDAALAASAVASSALPGAPEAAAAPGQPAEAAAAAQGVRPQLPVAVGVAADAEGAALPAKPETKRPRAGGSVLSMSSTMQSPAGNLLAGLAMKGGSGGGRSRSKERSSGGDGASVIGGQAASASPAAPAASSSSAAPPSRASPAASAPSTPAVPAVPTVATGERAPAAPGSSGQTPASNSTAQEPKKRPEGGAEPSGERRRRERDPNQSASKTVVSNFQSNSAASNLLGPMVARAGKKQVRKGDSDAKSAVG